VDKKYVHSPNPRPRWNEASCAESMNSSLIAIGRESYYMSADGMLMPVRKKPAAAGFAIFQAIAKVTARAEERASKSKKSRRRGRRVRICPREQGRQHRNDFLQALNLGNP